MEGFKDIAAAGVKHFETLFQEESNLHFPEVVKSAGYFPTTISVEDNEELIKPVALQEIQSILMDSQ